jgi:LacI family transcriptional regulator
MPLPTFLLASMAHGVEGELRERGMRLQLCGSIPPGWEDMQHFGPRVQVYEREVLGSLAHDAVAGVIWWSVFGNANRDAARRLQDQGLPVVLVDNLVPDLSCDWVGVDDFGVAVQATEHLLQLGHTEIAFLADCNGEYIYPTASHRLSGYLDAMRRAVPDRFCLDTARFGDMHFTFREDLAGLPARVRERIVFCDDRPLETLLSTSPRPSALVVGNDHLAHRFLGELEANGMSAPADIAVVSIGDIDRFTGRQSSLTTMRQPFEQIGRRAVRLLLQRLRDPARPVQHVHLGTRLIVRKSCGAPTGSYIGTSGAGVLSEMGAV